MKRWVRSSILVACALFVIAHAQAPSQVTVPTTDPMVVGAIAADGQAQGALVATAGGVAFHTFWVDVPAGVTRWTLTLDADVDLDLAVKFGAEIQDYNDRGRGGDWDYRDVETGNPTVLAIDAPQAGRWYVDVFNLLQAGTRGTYRLTLTTARATAPAGGGLPGKAGAGAAPAAAPTVVTAPTSESAVVGALPLEGMAQGALAAAGGGNSFHTYWVDMPAGVTRWTLTLDADVDLDLATKFGAEIQSYAERGQGGDWDGRNIETTNPAVLVIDAPSAGRWYVDVFNALAPGAVGNYRLSSTAGGGSAPAVGGTAPTVPGGSPTAPVGVPTPPAQPGGGPITPDQGIAGAWRLQGGEGLLTLEQDASGAIRGTMAGSGGSFTVEGTTDAQGTYGVIYDQQGGVYFVAVVRGNVLELTIYEADAQGDPLEESARQLLFERVTDGAGGANVPSAAPSMAAPPAPSPATSPATQPVTPPAAPATPSAGASVDLRAGLEVPAGTRVREAATGASLTIPSGWRAAVGEAPLLPLCVGSDTLPGLAVVLMTSGLTVDALARVLAEPIELDEATVLQPQGPPQQQGDRVSVRYAGGGGIGAGVARTSGGAGVVMLYVGGAGQESTGMTLLEALAASASFEQGSGTAALARVRQDWTGYRIWTYYFGGASGGTAYTSTEREAAWDLCANGRYVHTGSEETVGTAFSVGDVGWTTAVHQGGGVNTSSWQGRGTWTFAQVGEAIVLVLFDDGGATSVYRLSWTSTGQYQLDGSDIERRAVGPC